MLKEVDDQVTALDQLKKSQGKTFDYYYSTKKHIVKQFSEVYEANLQVLKMYTEGINQLKKYELHPALKKENKNYLIDIYYDEAQMNKWRDSCVRSQDLTKAKVEKLDKES